MGIFGQNWESAYVNTTVPYKVFSRHLIKAEVGVKVGLASVNITLRSKIVFFISYSLKNNIDVRLQCSGVSEGQHCSKAVQIF